MDSEHTWIDLWRYYRNGTSPEAIINHSVYARTAIESKTSRNIKLRFGFDDWLSVWLNGKHLAVVRHDNGIQSAEIPCRLHKGKNELLVKLSNFQNIEKQLFVLSCVVTDKR